MFWLHVSEQVPLDRIIGAANQAGVRVPEPDLKNAATAWILAGGPHHTALSYALNAEHLQDFTNMAGLGMFGDRPKHHGYGLHERTEMERNVLPLGERNLSEGAGRVLVGTKSGNEFGNKTVSNAVPESDRRRKETLEEPTA